MLESKWREKLQEQPAAPGIERGQLHLPHPSPGTQGKAETGKMEMADGFAAEPGMCQHHSWCPELFLKQEQQEEQGQGMAEVPGKGGSPGSKGQGGASGCRSTAGFGMVLLEEDCGTSCLWNSGLGLLLPLLLAFISSSAGSKGEESQAGAVCCLVAQGH